MSNWSPSQSHDYPVEEKKYNIIIDNKLVYSTDSLGEAIYIGAWYESQLWLEYLEKAEQDENIGPYVSGQVKLKERKD